MILLIIIIGYISLVIISSVTIYFIVRLPDKKHKPGNYPYPPADGRHVSRLHGSGDSFLKSGKGWEK